jgi:hypothetical protein
MLGRWKHDFVVDVASSPALATDGTIYFGHVLGT